MFIQFITEDGVEVRREVDESSLTIDMGDTQIQPTVVESVDADIEGNTDEITNQCGDTEIRKDGNTPWSVIAKGTITEDELSLMHQLGEREDSVTVSAPVLGDRSGEFIVPEGGLTLSDTNDVNFLRERGSDDRLPAFDFRLELKQPESQ